MGRLNAHDLETEATVDDAQPSLHKIPRKKRWDDSDTARKTVRKGSAQPKGSRTERKGAQ